MKEKKIAEKKKRSLLFFPLLLAMILSLSGCQGGLGGMKDGKDSEQGKNQALGQAGTGGSLNSDSEMTLRLYCVEEKNQMNSMVADTYIEAFNKIYPNITIEKTAFEDREQFEETVTAELDAGAGPDILLFDTSSLNMQKLAKNGAFAELDAYIEAEEEPIKKENYIEGVLEAGQVEGIQYWLPFSVVVPIVLYQPEDSHEFVPAPVISFEDFLASVLRDLENTRQDGQRATITQPGLVSCTLTPSRIVAYADEAQTYIYDEERLRSYVDFIAAIRKEDKEKYDQILAQYGDGIVSMIEHFTYQFYSPWEFTYLTKQVNGVNKAVKGGEIGVSVLSYGDGSVPAILGSWGAVNSNIGEKGPYAYAFLRTAMDTKLSVALLPVNKWRIQERITRFRNMYWKDEIDGVAIEDNGLGEKLAEDVMEIVNSINLVDVLNPAPVNIFEESFAPYFAGNQSYESCVSDFKQRMDMYAKE